MEFRILGPLEVVLHGKPVVLGPAKQRALLGLLLLHANEVVSNERLIDELWGARPPPTAAKLVQVYVSHLRKALTAAGAQEVLRTRAPGYVAVLSDEQLDSARFAGLVAEARTHRRDDALEAAVATYDTALAVWRGPVLDDLSFDSQARVETERLAELRLAAIGERIDCELACEHHAELIGELESLTARHPLHERFWAQLMLALYRSGRQSDALRAYRRARSTLVDELGLEPGPELQQLERAILTHDPSLGVTQRPGAGEVGAPSLPAAPTRVVAARRRLARGVALATVVLVVAAAAAAAVGFTRDAGSAPITVEPDSIAVIDPRRDELVADIPLHTKPAAIAYGAGGLWVATHDDGTLLEIDPRARRVTRTIGLGSPPVALAIDGRNVWVLCASGKTLFQFNGHTGQLVRKLAVGGTIRVGRFRGHPLPTAGLTVPDPFALAAGAGAAWIGYGGHVVTRVDSQTGATEQIAAGSARGVAFSSGAVWSVSSFNRSVSGPGILDVADGIWRIDPDTRAVAKIPMAPDFIDGGLGDGVVAGADALWMVNPVYRKVLKIDPSSLRVTAVNHLAGPQHPVALAAGPGVVWIASNDATVSRITPDTGAVVRTIPLGQDPRTASPIGLAIGGGFVWIAVH